MTEKSKIPKYIDDKKEIYFSLYSFLNDTSTNDFDFTEIEKHFKSSVDSDNREEFEQFLILILDMFNNHYRTENYLEKINNIFQHFTALIKQYFSNLEIFNIFKSNRLILLTLIKNGIISIDEDIFKEINGMIEMNGTKYRNYFYPEIKTFLSDLQIKSIENELLSENQDIFDDFDENRQKGENESFICSLIRKDSVEEFISHINRKSISLESTINPSIFETNPFLIESKSISLIEYSAFYGSIQIFKYLIMNSVELEPYLWLFAIHSNNAEIIHYLEENIKFPNKRCEMCYMEAIKCHHNEIAEYFKNQYEFDPKLDDEITSCILKYRNYSFFPSDFNESNEFFYLCYYKYPQIVKLFLEKKEKELQKANISIQKAAEENKTEIIYYLLLKETQIEEGLFTGIRGFRKLAIPPSITTIERRAFIECTSLELVSIPPSVTSIGIQAFCKCHSLKEITIPSSIKRIEAYTFTKCVGLKKVSIPSSVCLIAGYAFQSCNSLEYISITSYAKIMGIFAFEECYSIRYIDILSLKSIKSRIFSECSSLIKITIPSSVKSIGRYAFYHCASLKQISFEKPSSLESIDENAFDECSSLTQITIPSSVNSIKENAFRHCESLKHVFFETPSLLKSIENKAFLVCSSLENIEIPPSVSVIGQYVFDNCTSLKEISIPSSINDQNIGLNGNVKIIKI